MCSEAFTLLFTAVAVAAYRADAISLEQRSNVAHDIVGRKRPGR